MNRSAKFATACVFGCFLTLGALNAAAQEAKAEPPPVPPNQNLGDEMEARIDRMLDAYDLSPKPLPEVPDDPPPHEGAMIDMPTYRIEPPDLVLVEVLEALPGRPISGERLVGPDGTIPIGFYGTNPRPGPDDRAGEGQAREAYEKVSAGLRTWPVR